MNPSGFRRRTRQREIILDELRKVSNHPTAAGLHELVCRRLPKVSLATIYRNLERMAAAGEIQKFCFAGSESRFDGCVARHNHVRCVECGRLDDVPGPALEIPDQGQHDFHGYDILGYQLQYLGVCRACQAARRSAASGAGEADEAAQ